MATPGICASTSVSGAVLPLGPAAISAAPVAYSLAPVGETAGPAVALASTTTVLRPLSAAVASARAFWAVKEAARTAATPATPALRLAWAGRGRRAVIIG